MHIYSTSNSLVIYCLKNATSEQVWEHENDDSQYPHQDGDNSRSREFLGNAVSNGLTIKALDAKDDRQRNISEIMTMREKLKYSEKDLPQCPLSSTNPVK
jgi:hypothetical protein